MPQFVVETEWKGWVKTTDLLVVSFWNPDVFMTLKYKYDLAVSTADVDLAGTGVDQVDDKGYLVATKEPAFYAAAYPSGSCGFRRWRWPIVLTRQPKVGACAKSSAERTKPTKASLAKAKANLQPQAGVLSCG